MTITLTITDPTADESRAVRAYLDALHGGAAMYSAVFAERIEVRPASAFPREHAPDHGPEIITPKQDETNITITAPEPTTAEDAGAPDFDSAGLPWDERIHASSRATVADGTWRKKRGVSDELVAEVEAELARAGAEQVDAAVRAIAEAAGMTDAQTVDAPSVEPHDLGHVPDVVPEAPAPDSPPPPPAAPANPFLTVMSRIGKSKLDKAKKDELLTAAGALDDNGKPSILVLNKKPELIDGFVALLDSEGV